MTIRFADLALTISTVGWEAKLVGLPVIRLLEVQDSIR